MTLRRAPAARRPTYDNPTTIIRASRSHLPRSAACCRKRPAHHRYPPISNPRLTPARLCPDHDTSAIDGQFRHSAEQITDQEHFRWIFQPASPLLASSLAKTARLCPILLCLTKPRSLPPNGSGSL